MRTLAIILAAVVIAVGPQALAKSGNAAAPPQAQGSGNGNADGPNGAEPDKPTKPTPSGQAAGNPPGGPHPSSQGKGVPRGRTQPSEQNEAQRAVETHEALPLAKIVLIAEARSTGQVINAQLVRIDGVLLYRLTRLNEDGRSWREYYYARSGNPVILP